MARHGTPLARFGHPDPVVTTGGSPAQTDGTPEVPLFQQDRLVGEVRLVW